MPGPLKAWLLSQRASETKSSVQGCSGLRCSVGSQSTCHPHPCWPLPVPLSNFVTELLHKGRALVCEWTDTLYSESSQHAMGVSLSCSTLKHLIVFTISNISYNAPYSIVYHFTVHRTLFQSCDKSKDRHRGPVL